MRWKRILAGLTFLMFLGATGCAPAQLPDHSAENEKKVHASVAENDKKVHASVAEIAKWANEDVIWLDRIYALEQGILPAEDMALGQLTASSAFRGGQFELKGWVRRSDDLTRLEDRFAAHDGKMLVRSSREDRTVAPYAFAFDANMESKTKSETENKQQVDAASRDLKRLAEWQRRALPPDPVVARSLYQDWLRSLTDRARFRQAAIVANDAVARRAQYTRIAFHLEARARMGDLIEFMYEFYSAGFLHQIRSLNIKPVRGSHDLTVSLGIEALSLPTAECKDHLPKDAGSVLKFSKLSDYREPLVARDFFAYDGPVATPPRPGKAADPADFVVVTGFTEVDGKSQVWIQDRTKGSVSGFSAGESFDVGNVKGKVQSIRPKGEVVVEVDGHRRLLQAGDNLRGGVEIQDAQPNQPKESGNSTRPANP